MNRIPDNRRLTERAHLDFTRGLCLSDVVDADGRVGAGVGHLRLLHDEGGAATRVLRHQHALPHLRVEESIGNAQGLPLNGVGLTG